MTRCKEVKEQWVMGLHEFFFNEQPGHGAKGPFYGWIPMHTVYGT